MENWDQFEAVKEEDFTVWDRFAPVEEKRDLAKELPSIQAQEQKTIQDKLGSEDVREKDAIATDAAHQQQIATDLKTVAQRANKSFTAQLERDLANYNKPSEAYAGETVQYEKVLSKDPNKSSQPRQIPTKKPENIGAWIEQFAGSFSRQVESELEETRRQRARGIWKGRENRSDFGAAFQRGALGAIESLGSGLRGYGETMERQGINGTMFEDLGSALQKGGAYGRTAAPEAKVGTLEEIGWDRKKLGDYIVAKLGEGLGSSSVFFTAGGLGGVPAAGAAALTMGSGEVRSELERNGITDPKLLDQYSYIGGTAVGLLDTVVPAKLMQAMTKNVKKEIGKYVVTRIARGTMKGAATEGVTEAMQEAIEIASAAEAGGDQAALDYIKQLNKKHAHGDIIPNANERATHGVLALEALAKDWKRVVEAGAAGAIPGAAMSGGGAVISEARSKEAPPKTEQPVKQGIADALAEEPVSQKQAPAAKAPEVITLPDETGVIVRPDESGQTTLPDAGAQQASSLEPVATPEPTQPTSAEGAKLPDVKASTEVAPTEETTTTFTETQIKPVSQSEEANRQALKQQFDELQKTISELDAMPEVPTDLADDYLDQAESMVEAFQEQGLPGMTPEEAQNIGTIEEVLQAFDTATPEEISAFWREDQVETVTPAVQQTEVAAKTVPNASTPGKQRGTPLKPESMGAMSSRQKQRMAERREELDRYASEVEVVSDQEAEKTAIFGQRVQGIAKRLSTPPLSQAVSIAQVYDAYGKIYKDAGSLQKFKERLLQANASNDIRLRTLDEPEILNDEVRNRSLIKTPYVYYHLVHKFSQEDVQPKTQLQSTSEEFYDYLESKAPLKTETIAKKLGVDAETVKQLAAEAGKAGWLTKTKEGKWRRVHISKRPSRSKTTQTKGVPLRPESMAARSRVRGMQLPGAESVAPDSIAPAARSGVTLPEMSMTEIKRNIIDALGLKVRRGRLNEAMKREAKKRGQVLQGQYDEETDIVRVREMNDVETIFHEAGHQQINTRFSERFGAALAHAMSTHEAELQALDPSGNNNTEEGFADFFRRYLTNYKMARVHAPNFYRQFENVVGGINPDLLANMQEVQKRVEEYQTSTSAGRLMSSTKSTVKLGKIETTKQDFEKYGRYAPMKWMRDIRGWLQKVYHSRVSDVNYIHLFTIEAAKNAERNNKHLDFSFWKNPSKQAQQLNNAYTAGFSDLTEGVHYFGVNRKGSVSYYDALEHAFGGQERAQWTEQMMNAFGTYLLARRGQWLWQRFQPDSGKQITGEFTEPPSGTFTNGQWYLDKTSNVARVWINGKWENELTHAPDKNSRADHEEAISSLEKEHPQFKEAANLMYKFLQNWTLKEYQAGLLTEEAFKQRLATADYVPWFRIMDEDQAFVGAKTKRKVQQQRALHGSYRDFVNPLESIAKMVYEGNYNIRVNNMKRTMQEVAMSSGVGYGHLAEPIDPTQVHGTKVNLFDALRNEARKRGVTDEDTDALITSVVGYIGDNGNTTVFKRGEINERGERVIYYLRKGELNAFVLADDNIGKGVFHFFQTLGDAPDLDGLVNLIAAPGRLMQTAVTSHPRFQVWNMIRDQFMAPAMVPGYIPFVSNVKTALDNWYLRRQESGVTWSEIVASRAGIMGGMNTTAHMQLRQKRDIKALRQKGVTWNPVKADFWLGTVSPFSKQFWRWTEASEASTRQTIARIEYNHALKEMKKFYPGMPQEELEFIALEEAVFKSSNYVPYNRGGQKMAFLRQIIRFLNAGIQGTDRSFKVALAAEMESGQWAMPRAIKKGTKTVAAMVMPWLKHSRGEPLTKMEKKALGRAFYYWSVVASIAMVQNILRAMGDDDDEALKEELTDYHDTTYVHVSLPYTDDVVAFFPRGFDLVGTLSNAISTGYDAQWRQDPTAKDRFLESSYRMLLPAHSVAGLDVYSGLFENYDRFTERPIIPDYMKRGLLPEDQHHGWIDPISLELGKKLGVSPNQVSFAMSKLGSQYANDLKTIAIAASPNREALHWWEYPIISSFFRNPEKFSRSKQKYYDTILEYHQNLGSYKQRINERDQTEIKRFLEAATPDMRAYLVAQNHVDAKQRRLHPLVRAQEIYTVTNGIIRDIVMDRLPQAGPLKKKEAYLTLSPTQKKDAFDILRGIEMRELRRTLILMKIPGWAQKRDDLLKPDKYYDELKKVLPQVWDIYQQRTHGGRRGNEPRIYDFATVKRLWSDVRNKLLSNNVLADIVDTRGEVKENILLPEMVEAQGASR